MRITSYNIKSTGQERSDAKIPRPGDARCPGSNSSGHYSRCPYVEWENQDDPFYELSLVGKTLKIGDQLEVAIVERDPRCKMITLDPDTAEATPTLLRHLARNHGGNAGVFAAVLDTCAWTAVRI